MSARTFVKFYKDGDTFALETNHSDYGAFVRDVVSELSAMIEANLFESDWQFQLDEWLPQIMEIGSKLRGYKAEVSVQQVITAGALTMSDAHVIRAPQPGVNLPPEPSLRG